LVDRIEHSVFQSGSVIVGVTHKRGPGPKLQLKVSAMLDDVGWRYIKVILLKAVLSQPAIRKATWQYVVSLFWFS